MRRLALAAVLLSGCVAQGPGESYRDAGDTIASAALFDPSRFGDVWHVAAAYGPDAVCGPLAETWTPTGPGTFRVTGTACGPSGARAFAGDARVTGPGRITREGLRGPETLWVLWVDADYRIAVLGTPDGTIGRVLSRTPEPRQDLWIAAREVLDFNGYDLERLVRL